MKLCITQDWHRKPELENLLFLAQRLDELFFDYTLDTYKPPALNSVYLCKEAISLLIDIENDLIDVKNLKSVIDELEWSVSNDLIAKELLPTNSKKFIHYDEKTKLSDLKIKLEVLERIINPIRYIQYCEEQLKAEMLNGSKKKINSIARCYASALINRGISKQHLKEKTTEFFFNNEKVYCFDDLEQYFYLVSPTVHSFEVYFSVSKLVNEVSKTIDKFNLNILEKLPDKLIEFGNANHFCSDPEQVIVEVLGIEAYDRHTARMEAESRLDMLGNLFSLFSHKNKIKWANKVIITQCCDDTPVTIKKPMSAMEKCFDLRPKAASYQLNQMINSINLSGNSFFKFNRAVDLHSVGVSNDLPENQLMNIWIALETLIPSHVHGGGKVTKIINGLMPVLLRNYLKRLVKRVSLDLLNWDKIKTSKILKKIPNSTGKPPYLKVFELIALKDNSELLKELYVELADFFLLRNRLFELSEMFKKPQNIIQKINLHRTKVEWQIRRIYRTRNLIVHSGRTLPYIDTLIENAHDYLDQAMNMVIELSCSEIQVTTLEQAFEVAKLDFDEYMMNLESVDEIDYKNAHSIIC